MIVTAWWLVAPGDARVVGILATDTVDEDLRQATSPTLFVIITYWCVRISSCPCAAVRYCAFRRDDDAPAGAYADAAVRGR